MKHKKLVALIFAMIITVLVSALPTTVAAIDCSETASLRYVGLQRISARLEINNAIAGCHGYATTASSSYTAEVTMELQKQDDSWQTIKTWYDSGQHVVLGKIWAIESGYDYRVKLTVEVYDSSGNLVESPSVCSSTMHY